MGGGAARKLAAPRLVRAELPDEKLPEGPFCFPQPLSQVLRERERELENCARVRFLQAVVCLLGEREQLNVGGGQCGEQVLAPDQQRESAQRVAGRHFADGRAALARQELQLAAGDEEELRRGLACAEGVGAAAHRARLAPVGEDAQAYVGEVAQQHAAAQRGDGGGWRLRAHRWSSRYLAPYPA